MSEEAKPLSRSEREVLIKDKAGWIITVIAAFLAINTLLSGSNSSKILNSTIAANDVYSFYQAKSIKQASYEIAANELEGQPDKKELLSKYKAIIARYESEPSTGEGKKELLDKANALEAERDKAKKSSPFYTYAASLLQIAIVLLTASILAVNQKMLWASIIIGFLGVISMSHAIWLWIPFITN